MQTKLPNEWEELWKNVEKLVEKEKSHSSIETQDDCEKFTVKAKILDVWFKF